MPESGAELVAGWPDLDMLKRTLDVSSDDLDDELQFALQGAITGVQADIEAEGCIVGHEGVDEDEPCSRLTRAALLRAVRDANAPAEPSEQITAARSDPNYWRLLLGHRRRHKIA